MKKLILLVKLFFLASLAMAQTTEIGPDQWSFMTDTSAFDGVSRAALIIGTSTEVGSPMLSVNRTDEQKTKVYLSYWPSGICGSTNLTIKFKNEKTLYNVSALYSIRYRRYVIDFNNNLTVESFIEKLKIYQKFYIRMISQCVTMDVEFTLEGASEALEILK